VIVGCGKKSPQHVTYFVGNMCVCVFACVYVFVPCFVSLCAYNMHASHVKHQSNTDDSSAVIRVRIPHTHDRSLKTGLLVDFIGHLKQSPNGVRWVLVQGYVCVFCVYARSCFDDSLYVCVHMCMCKYIYV